MNILFNCIPYHAKDGGAVVKIHKLKEYLERRGHRVDLYDQWSMNIEEYDIYHHFSFMKWDFPMLEYVQATGTPIVLETMYWGAFENVWRFPHRTHSARFRALAHRAVKTFLPRLSPQRPLGTMASHIIANSEVEKQFVGRHFSINPDMVTVVPNGADHLFAESTPDLFVERFGLKDFVLCVGMFEVRKNQLSLIRALNGTNVPLVFIGNVPPTHKKYYESCREEARENVHFVDFIPHNDPLLASAFAASDTLVLPSWHETTGKVALEAGLAGTKLVITRNAPMEDYIGKFAQYINPADISGMRETIQQSLSKQFPLGLTEYILKNFTWDPIASKRESLYSQILARNEVPADEPHIFTAGKKCSKEENKLGHALLAQNLRDVKHLFEKIGVESWLDSGTLLGAVRDEAILPWDHDIDLGMFMEEAVKVELCHQVFEEHDFRVTVFRNKGFLYRIELLRHDWPINIEVFESCGDRAWSLWKVATGRIWDVHVKATSRIGNKFMKTLYHGIKTIVGKVISKRIIAIFLFREQIVFRVVQRRYFENLESVKFLGLDFNTPADAESYLGFRYGTNWRTPKEEWTFWKDDGSVTSDELM